MDNDGEWRDGYWCSTEKANDRLDVVMSKTPVQSLAAHDAAIEDDVITRCMEALVSFGTIKADGNYCQSIRNMPRKYSV